LKPREAEKALKTEWDKVHTDRKTEAHACEILAKVVVCRHISPRAYACSSLVQEIQSWLQQHKAAVGAAAEASKPNASRCFPAWLFLIILHVMAMAKYWKHTCVRLLTQIAVTFTWALNCRICEIKETVSVGARKKKAKKKDGTRKQSGQGGHEVAGLSLLREVSTFVVLALAVAGCAWLVPHVNTGPVDLNPWPLLPQDCCGWLLVLRVLKTEIAATSRRGGAGKALMLAGLVVLALEVAGCVWLEPYVKTGLVDWRVSSTAPPPAPIPTQDSGCLLVLLVLKAVGVWGVAFVVQQHQNRRPERERACGAAADTTVCVEPGKAAGGGAADSRSYLTAATLAVLVAASQVSSAQAYGCTNDTHCQYSPCSTYACSSSSSNCVNGKWRAYCGYNLDIEVGRYWGCYRWSSGYPPPWCGDPQACPAGQYSIGGGKNGGGDYACRSCDAGKYASTAGTYVRLSTKLKAHPRELNLHVWKMPVTENISDISE
jgi:hypothetical protein